jgi:hypothetical protein
MSEAAVAEATATTTAAPAEASATTEPEAAAAPAQPDATKDTTATEQEKAPEPKAEPKDFLALKRGKQEIFKKEQALKSREKQLEQYDKEVVLPVRHVLETFDDDPAGLLSFVGKAKGKSPQEVFDTLVTSLAKQGEPPDPNDRVTKLERQLAEKDAAEKAKREAEEAKLAEQAEAEWRNDLSSKLGVYLGSRSEELATIATRSEYYELKVPGEGIKVLTGKEAARQVHNDLMDLAEAWYSQHGQTLTTDQAADLLEKQFFDEDDAVLTNRLQKNPKFSTRFAPPAPPAPPAPVQTPAQPPTNAAASAPAGDTTNENSSPRHIPARRAVVPAGSRVARRSSSEDDQAFIERIAKNVRFT